MWHSPKVDDGSVALCCSVYDQAQMLGVSFLEQSHAQLEVRKYKHPFCRTCMKHSLDYSVAELPGTA